MGVLEIIMEKQLIHKGSHYHIRNVYLDALKQFMADDQQASRTQINKDIEEYLLYEKQVSFRLQELIERSAFKAIHN